MFQDVEGIVRGKRLFDPPTSIVIIANLHATKIISLCRNLSEYPVLQILLTTGTW